MMRSVRSRVLLLLSCTAIAVTGATLWASRKNTEQLIWTISEDLGDLLGTVIAQTIAVSNEVPDQLESSMDQDLVTTARMLARYVAAAEKSGARAPELRRELKKIASEGGVTEIWITDPAGKAYLSSTDEESFRFTPDATQQPQAAAFWPLLAGGAQEVIQPAMPRDLDGKFFKYVGVAGVDKPRIVQVGVEAEMVIELRGRLSLKQTNEELVRAGVLRKAMVVVDERLQPLGQSGSTGSASAALSPAQQQRLAEAIKSGKVQYSWEPDSVDMYRSFRSSEGRYTGAFMASFPRDEFDNALSQQTTFMLSLGAGVLLVSMLSGWLFSRRITQPLDVLSAAARKIGKGNFAALDSLGALKARNDEMGQLGTVFHGMGIEIRDREKVLEEQVARRTLELAARNTELQAAQNAISSELEFARSLQLGILPRAFPKVPGYVGAARVLMQQQMGGDFYDFIPLSDGRLALVMADVSGKGLTAAFFMAMTRTSLSLRVAQTPDPAAALALVNDDLLAANPLDLFVTVFLAILDPATGDVHHASAGHNPPLWLRADGRVQTMTSPGEPPLGVLPGMVYTSEHALMGRGDALFLYTDGVTEAFDEQLNDYGMQRLQALLKAHAGAPPEAVLEVVFDDVRRFVGAADQSDDITAAVVSREQSDH